MTLIDELRELIEDLKSDDELPVDAIPLVNEAISALEAAEGLSELLAKRTEERDVTARCFTSACREREALQEELVSANLAYALVQRDCHDLTEKVIPNLRTERDSLTEQLGLARKDAERYRWLRDASPNSTFNTPTVVDGFRGIDDHCTMLEGVVLDAAIDAAIASQAVPR